MGEISSITPGDANNIAKSLCATLNTKRFLRKKLEEEEINRLISLLIRHIGRGDPVPFVMLWGVDKKRRPGYPEEDAVKQLQRLEHAIRDVWPAGMRLTVVYADVHGKINRIPEQYIEQYYKNMSAFFEEQVPFITDFLRLSDLRNGFNATARLEKEMSEKSLAYRNHPCFELVLTGSKLHFQGDNVIKGALEYISARMVDRKIIEHYFVDHIHLTYNRPNLAFLQPDLLTLYVWSSKKGRSRAPWYDHGRKVFL